MNYIKLFFETLLRKLRFINGNKAINEGEIKQENTNISSTEDSSRLKERIDNYQFEKTKAFIHREINEERPIEEMCNLLEAVIELLNYPDNDYCWSSWESAESAVKEIESLLKQFRNNEVPNKDDIDILFAPTGPMQEVSLSSGWGDGFLKIAEKYDQIERLLWK